MHHSDVYWYNDAFHGSQGHQEIFAVPQEIVNTELLKWKAAYKSTRAHCHTTFS